MYLGLPDIKTEELQERWYNLPEIDKKEFIHAKNYVIDKVRKNLRRFTAV